MRTEDAPPRVVVAVVAAGRELALAPVAASGRGDLAVLDRVLRLALAARRLGCSLTVTFAATPVRDLAALAGVDDLLGL